MSTHFFSETDDRPLPWPKQRLKDYVTDLYKALTSYLQRHEDYYRRQGMDVHADMHRAVLDHGRYYRRAPRPKGFGRQRARKQCYINATLVSEKTGATYVEGFAMSPDMPPFQHAWVTTDGVHAIDQTLPDGERYEYLGVPFPQEVLIRAMNQRGYFGLLEEFNPVLLGLEPLVSGDPVPATNRINASAD